LVAQLLVAASAVEIRASMAMTAAIGPRMTEDRRYEFIGQGLTEAGDPRHHRISGYRSFSVD